jgi:ribosomal protein S27AE
MTQEALKLANEPCKHAWQYALQLYAQTGKRYVCGRCGERSECFDGRDSQIEANIEQARKELYT